MKDIYNGCEQAANKRFCESWATEFGPSAFGILISFCILASINRSFSGQASDRISPPPTFAKPWRWLQGFLTHPITNENLE
jgi:hypothetical protein